MYVCVCVCVCVCDRIELQGSIFCGCFGPNKRNEQFKDQERLILYPLNKLVRDSIIWFEYSDIIVVICHRSNTPNQLSLVIGRYESCDQTCHVGVYTDHMSATRTNHGLLSP